MPLYAKYLRRLACRRAGGLTDDNPRALPFRLARRRLDPRIAVAVTERSRLLQIPPLR